MYIIQRAFTEMKIIKIVLIDSQLLNCSRTYFLVIFSYFSFLPNFAIFLPIFPIFGSIFGPIFTNFYQFVRYTETLRDYFRYLKEVYEHEDTLFVYHTTNMPQYQKVSGLSFLSIPSRLAIWDQLNKVGVRVAESEVLMHACTYLYYMHAYTYIHIHADRCIHLHKYK